MLPRASTRPGLLFYQPGLQVHQERLQSRSTAVRRPGALSWRARGRRELALVSSHCFLRVSLRPCGVPGPSDDRMAHGCLARRPAEPGGILFVPYELLARNLRYDHVSYRFRGY